MARGKRNTGNRGSDVVEGRVTFLLSLGNAPNNAVSIPIDTTICSAMTTLSQVYSLYRIKKVRATLFPGNNGAAALAVVAGDDTAIVTSTTPLDLEARNAVFQVQDTTVPRTFEATERDLRAEQVWYDTDNTQSGLPVPGYFVFSTATASETAQAEVTIWYMFKAVNYKNITQAKPPVDLTAASKEQLLSALSAKV